MDNELYTKKMDTFTHVSTALATAEGVFDTEIRLEDIKQWGDFGFGGTAGLEEGILILNNEIHFPKKVDSKKTIGISLLTFFNSKEHKEINTSMNLKQLGEYVQSLMPSKNIIYAVKFEGEFEFVKLAILPSFKKPYPKLTPEDIDRAKKIQKENISGTLLAFWLPDYAKKINSGAGKLHVHFISSEKDFAGHVEDCKVISGSIDIDYKHSFNIVLPENDDFYSANLDGVNDKMIKRFSTWTQKDD